MSKLFIHECGGNLGNMTNQIEISSPVDFALVVEDKSYRMQADRDGNLLVSLINGVDAKFVSSNGYPTICLTKNDVLSSDWYECLKDHYGT
jgi:hypothetical protein